MAATKERDMTTLTLMEKREAVPARMQLLFPSGMPGLEAYHRFTLIALDDSPAYWLECDDEVAIVLPLADAFAVVPDYSFTISTADVRALALTEEADALVLVILTLPADGGAITANMFAPIVANRHNGRARQIILDGSGHSLRHPLSGKDED
jgi:flagellar assembly factor FliW